MVSVYQIWLNFILLILVWKLHDEKWVPKGLQGLRKSTYYINEKQTTIKLIIIK
jgi:hypothetical protein